MTFSDFLEGERTKPTTMSSSRCQICTNENLKQEVDQYVAGVLDGSVSHTQNYVWRHYFGPTYQMRSASTLRNHIAMHLGVDLNNV